MSFKKLYQFTIDKEVEKMEETTKKDRKTGEEITTKKPVIVKEPIEFFIKRPSRRELEEAELEYSVEMSRCVKKGILTKAMLAKKYSDTGGIFSEDEAKAYSQLYKEVLELQNEYIRLDSADQKDAKQKKRFEVVKSELAETKRKIVEIESGFQSFFDHTADIKAQNRLLLWYVINLTYIQNENENDDKPQPYFEGSDFESKIEDYYKKEESNDAFYFAAIKKASTILAFWFFNQASEPKEFDELIEKMEKGKL
jgi:hypothetical protein